MGQFKYFFFPAPYPAMPGAFNGPALVIGTGHVVHDNQVGGLFTFRQRTHCSEKVIFVGVLHLVNEILFDGILFDSNFGGPAATTSDLFLAV